MRKKGRVVFVHWLSLSPESCGRQIDRLISASQGKVTKMKMAVLEETKNRESHFHPRWHHRSSNRDDNQSAFLFLWQSFGVFFHFINKDCVEQSDPSLQRSPFHSIKSDTFLRSHISPSCVHQRSQGCLTTTRHCKRLHNTVRREGKKEIEKTYISRDRSAVDQWVRPPSASKVRGQDFSVDFTLAKSSLFPP